MKWSVRVHVVALPGLQRIVIVVRKLAGVPA